MKKKTTRLISSLFMKQKMKRLTSVLLALVMMAGLLPLGQVAYAAGEDEIGYLEFEVTGLGEGKLVSDTSVTLVKARATEGNVDVSSHITITSFEWIESSNASTDYPGYRFGKNRYKVRMNINISGGYKLDTTKPDAILFATSPFNFSRYGMSITDKGSGNCEIDSEWMYVGTPAFAYDSGIRLSNSGMPDGTLGKWYSFTVPVQQSQPLGSNKPVVSLTNMSLPNGLTLKDGIISGVPTNAGTFYFELTANDGVGIVKENFSIKIENDAPNTIYLFDMISSGIEPNKDISAATISCTTEHANIKSVEWEEYSPTWVPATGKFKTGTSYKAIVKIDIPENYSAGDGYGCNFRLDGTLVPNPVYGGGSTALGGYKTVTVQLQWRSVVFNENGHGTAPNAQLVLYDTLAKEPVAPTDESYTFGGWYSKSDCSGSAWKFNSWTVTSHETLFAKWTKKSYTITFESNGGSASATNATTGTDGKLTSLPTATRDGYSFMGWFTQPNGGSRITTDTVFNSSTTVYARWSAKYHTITVNGGTADRSAAPPQQTVNITASTRENYTFKDWTVVSGGITLENANSATTSFKMGTQDVLIRANYTYSGPMIDTVYINITEPKAGVNPSDAVSAATDQYVISDTVWTDKETNTKLSATDKFVPGKTYKVKVYVRNVTSTIPFNTSAMTAYVNDSTDGVAVNLGMGVIDVEKEFTVAAQESYNVHVNIMTYDTDGVTIISETGGTASASKDIAAPGETVTVSAMPNSGYKLKAIKWGDDGTSTDITTEKQFIMEDFDVVVDVYFQKESASVTVESISIETPGKTAYEVGDSLDVSGMTIKVKKSDGTSETIPVTEAMVSGFNSSAPAASQTLTITYEGQTTTYDVSISATAPVTYDITVNAGDGGTANASASKATEGTTITVTATPNSGYEVNKITYTPDGESAQDITSTKSFTMPAKKVTVDVTFKKKAVTPISYTVTFDENGHGTAPAAQTIESGNKATKPADLTETGWTFGGWFEDKTCTVAYDFDKPVTDDITLYAKWTKDPFTPVTYTVTFAANGGTGSMADVTGISGEYTLPANGFTAPEGKQFKGWSVGGVEKAAGDTITVNANTTVTAIWETIPAGHTCDIKPVAKVEPSCTEGGKEAYYKCEGCGKFYEDALGAKEITDLAAWGNLEKLGHTESGWKSDKDNHWKECTVAGCGVIIENSKAAHKDDNNDGKCDTCEYNVGTTTTKPEDTNKPSDDVQSPQTGDNSMMWLWVALLFVSGFGVVATTVYGKRRTVRK